jgi:hypothetical protein
MRNKMVQTRSESGGLEYFDTVQEALTYANEHEDVWKISFEAKTGERIRLVRRPTYDLANDCEEAETNWSFEPIEYGGKKLM